MKKLYQILIIVCTGVITSSCGLGVSHGIKGVVLEEGTNKPVEGAIIMARWFGEKWPIEPVTKCFHVEVTTSDVNGQYEIPNTILRVGYKIYNNMHVNVVAYKPGYRENTRTVKAGGSFDSENTITLKDDVTNKKSRIKYLENIAGGYFCRNGGKVIRKQYPLYEAIYEEASIYHVDEKTNTWFLRQLARVATSVDGNMLASIAEERRKRFIEEYLKR